MVLPAALFYKGVMLNADRINEIHRRYHGEHWSVRKIARHLHLARKTLRKYLQSPVQAPAHRPRATKIDPFKSAVAGLLEQDPSASSIVILQRLRPLGYEGGITILRAYVSELRSPLHPPRAFVRMEPAPAERFEVDWGHFGALDYAGDKRKLYAFCLVDGHSRMLYVEFTHSQSFETFVRCHLHAFQALGGVARECWYDNLLTVVAEHVGTLVRFNPRFLSFRTSVLWFVAYRIYPFSFLKVPHSLSAPRLKCGLHGFFSGQAKGDYS
jgi:transposase